MSTQSLGSGGRVLRTPREQPSKVTKQRLSQILQQEVQECGRAARQMCQQSGSREVSIYVAFGAVEGHFVLS